MLRRVLQNFLTNAFRYNPHGKVLLGVRRERDRYRIEVWDNGPGIPEERQADIFHEFTRIDRKGAEQGLGLGLAIARGISRILGQPLGLRSWPEEGTVFSILVNKAIGQQENEEQEAVPVRNQPLSHLRVLCVDNDTDILLGMENLLSRWGCDVRCATDVFEAMRQLEDDWVPQFILSDYHLANDQTGLQVLQQCRLKLGMQFRGVVISADRTPETRQTILNLGFGFISKPVKPLKLRSALNQGGN